MIYSSPKSEHFVLPDRPPQLRAGRNDAGMPFANAFLFSSGAVRCALLSAVETRSFPSRSP